MCRGHITIFIFPIIYRGRDFSIQIAYHAIPCVDSVAVHDIYYIIGKHDMLCIVMEICWENMMALHCLIHSTCIFWTCAVAYTCNTFV